MPSDTWHVTPHLHVLHQVPGVLELLAAGAAGEHLGRAAAVVQPAAGVSLALAGEPQLAVVPLVGEQAGDGVETQPAIISNLTMDSNKSVFKGQEILKFKVQSC